MVVTLLVFSFFLICNIQTVHDIMLLLNITLIYSIKVILNMMGNIAIC